MLGVPGGPPDSVGSMGASAAITAPLPQQYGDSRSRPAPAMRKSRTPASAHNVGSSSIPSYNLYSKSAAGGPPDSGGSMGALAASTAPLPQQYRASGSLAAPVIQNSRTPASVHSIGSFLVTFLSPLHKKCSSPLQSEPPPSLRTEPHADLPFPGGYNNIH
ncbi:hypothetical protein MRX96_050293 [Rhipicephalus microplus]